MKGMKKILTLALSLFMAFSLCMTVCADDDYVEVGNETEFRNALNKDGEIKIKLKNDVEINGRVDIANKDVTINLNGKNLIGDSSASYCFLVVQGGKLEFTGTGTVKEKVADYRTIYVIGSNDESKKSDTNFTYTTLIIGENATVEGYDCIGIHDFNNGYKYGIKVIVNGTLNSKLDTSGACGSGIHVYDTLIETSGNVPEITLSSTSKITSQAIGIFDDGYAKWNLAGTIEDDDLTSEGFNALPLRQGEYIITGGTYKSTDISNDPAVGPSGSNKNSGAAICLASDSATTKKLKVTISGGEFISKNGYALLECIANNGVYGNSLTPTSTSPAANSSYAELEITGGTFKGALGAVKLNDMSDKQVISGGKFSHEVSRYLKNEYNIYVNADNLYEVVEKGQAAKSINQNSKVTSSLDYENIYEGIEDMFGLDATDYIILDAEEVTSFTKEDKDAVIKEIIKAEPSKISADDIDYILPLDIKLGANNYRSNVEQLDTPITLYLNEATLKELSGKNVKVVRFDKDKEADDDNYFLNVVDTSLKENGLTFDALTFSTKYVIVAYDIPSEDTPIKSYDDKDKNQDGIVDCEEEMNSSNWVWSNTKKACVYKVSNTGTK